MNEPISDAEKRVALDQVLQSAPFLRADQLRNFLRYICEMELAGRAATLSEYLIGVEALGRRPAYSTADDSSVRRRAYALRQKLDEIYERELAAATIRIDVPKGSYAPRFTRTPCRPASPAEVRLKADHTTERTRVARSGWLSPGMLWLMAAFVTGTLFGFAVSQLVDRALPLGYDAAARPSIVRPVAASIELR